MRFLLFSSFLLLLFLVPETDAEARFSTGNFNLTFVDGLETIVLHVKNERNNTGFFFFFFFFFFSSFFFFFLLFFRNSSIH
jgi:hypothetical protein